MSLSESFPDLYVTGIRFLAISAGNTWWPWSEDLRWDLTQVQNIDLHARKYTNIIDKTLLTLKCVPIFLSLPCSDTWYTDHTFTNSLQSQSSVDLRYANGGVNDGINAGWDTPNFKQNLGEGIEDGSVVSPICAISPGLLGAFFEPRSIKLCPLNFCEAPPNHSHPEWINGQNSFQLHPTPVST